MINQPETAPATSTAVDAALARYAADEALAQVKVLQNKVTRFDTYISELENRTGLISPSLVRRAFTVWGHMLLAQLLVTGAILLLFVAFYLLAGVAH